MLTNPLERDDDWRKSGEREELTIRVSPTAGFVPGIRKPDGLSDRAERVPVRIDGSEPEEVMVQLVSPEYSAPWACRLCWAGTQSDDDPAAPNAVISYDYWQRRFGGRTDVVGSRIAIRQGVFSIIGVAPASFFGETVGQRPGSGRLSPCSPRCCGPRLAAREPGDRDKVCGSTRSGG